MCSKVRNLTVVEFRSMPQYAFHRCRPNVDGIQFKRDNWPTYPTRPTTLRNAHFACPSSDRLIELSLHLPQVHACQR